MSETACSCGAGLPEYPYHSAICPKAGSDPRRCAAVSLILDHSDGEPRLLCVWNHRYNGWAMPGGKVEPGESPQDAQKRELEEETGMLTERAHLLYCGPHDIQAEVIRREGRAAVVYVFAVTAFGEPREMEEGCPVAWMTTQAFLAQSPFKSFYEPVLDKLVAQCDCIDCSTTGEPTH